VTARVRGGAEDCNRRSRQKQTRPAGCSVTSARAMTARRPLPLLRLPGQAGIFDGSSWASPPDLSTALMRATRPLPHRML
jgi:hypothetical protein